MRGSYFLRNEPTTEAAQHRKSGKLHWLWAILFLIVIIVFIALVIVGFYNLPEIENETAETDYYRSLPGQVRVSNDFFGSFDTDAIIREVQKTFSNSEDIYDTTYKMTGNFSRSAKLVDRVQNVAIKLSPKNAISNKTIILSGYFQESLNDSFVTSRNRIAKSLMGYLRYLTEPEYFLRHPIIILLNKGERDNAQSLEDFFVNNKELAENIGVLINFGTMAGGRGNMIQTQADSRLLLEAYYKSFRQPHVCLICDEIAKSNFLELGSNTKHVLKTNKIKRLDLLYVYRNDSLYMYLSNQQSEQHMQVSFSKSILSLVQNVDRAKELDEETEADEITQSIFFGFFDIFLIIYSNTDGIIINVVVSIFALATILLSMRLMQQWAVVSIMDMLIQFSISFGIQLGSLLIGGGVAFFMAFLYDCYKSFLTWVPKYWLVFGIYFCPFIFIMATFPILYLGWKKYRPIPIRFGIMLFQHVNCLIFIIAILTLTGLSVGTAFVIVSGIAFYTVSLMVVLIFRLYKRKYLWIVPILIAQIFPIIFITYLLMIFYSVYIPVSAMPGTPRTLQFLLAISAIGFSMLMFGFMIPIFAIFRKSKTLLCGFILVMVIFLILVFTNMFLS